MTSLGINWKEKEMNDRPTKAPAIILKGAFILTIAALCSKILSAVYRVPFQNIVGDVGFYIYQQVYPIYGVSILLATSGFPVMISKLMNDSSTFGHENSSLKVLKVSSLFLTIFGFGSFLILYSGAPFIALGMGDEELSVLIRVISLSFLMIPFVSILRGYFQSEHMMPPTALSQVTEQFIRVLTIIILSYLFVQNGYDLYITGAGALFGSLLGSIAALFVLMVFIKKAEIPWRAIILVPVTKKERFIILRKLFKYSLTICFASMLLIFMQMIDSFQVYRILVESGWSEHEAKVLKGVYDRGQPLLQLGAIVATSFALSFVPAIAKGVEDVQQSIQYAFKVCLSLAIAATAGIIAIIEPLNIMLFSNGKGSSVLAVYCLSILFCSIAITSGAVLQGLDKAEIPAITVLIGIGVKWISNVWFIEKWDTLGAALATVCAFLVIALLNLLFIRKEPFRLLDRQDVLNMTFIAFVMVIIIKVIQLFFFSDDSDQIRLLATANALVSVLIGAFIYVGGLVLLKVVTKEDWEFLIGKK